jgi:hypothetical protein
MKVDIRSRGHAPAHRCLLAGIILGSLFLPSWASARLGGDVTSVEADRQQMKANLARTSNGRYEVHELQVGGSVVREFVSPDGNVFGVAWKGSVKPQYSQLLGSYTNEISKAAESRQNHRAPLVIHQPTFVFSSYGHMRFYVGCAYIPSLLPPGVLPEEIQ